MSTLCIYSCDLTTKSNLAQIPRKPFVAGIRVGAPGTDKPGIGSDQAMCLWVEINEVTDYTSGCREGDRLWKIV